MAEDRRTGPTLHLLSGRSGAVAFPATASVAEAADAPRSAAKPAISRHARRVAIPSLSVAAAPLVHWTPSATREGDAFRWAGSMLSLCEKGEPFVLLLHGGLRRADASVDAPQQRDNAPLSAEDRADNAGSTSIASASDGAESTGALWRPYIAWLGKHRSVWQNACRGVIVISADIVTRVDARNDAQSLFGEGTRVVVVSQEALAHQLARVLIAERQAARGNADAVARGSM